MENCLFCKFIAGEIHTDIVYQDDNVFAFRDNNPQAPVHVLFVPKRHIASITDITPEDGALLANIYIAAKNVAQELGLEKGYRFIINVGPDAGQSVFHLHIHLLGGRDLGRLLGPSNPLD